MTQNWGRPSFTTAESLAEMWSFVRYFISAYMPIIMIVVAVFICWGVVALVLQIFVKDEDEDDDPVVYM